MRIRWFGSPWGREDKRAPICEDDAYRVDVPVGTKCLLCAKRIEEHDQGVITACSPSIFGHWLLEIETVEDDIEMEWGSGESRPLHVTQSVCSYHMFCWIKETIGSEKLTNTILSKMNFRVGEDPVLVKADEPDRVVEELSPDDVRPGRGWK